MDRLEELKQKYSPVLQFIGQGGVRLDHLHVQDDKLYMEGGVASDELKNKVWDQIKAVDPAYSDLICDLRVDSTVPAPAPHGTTYTVKAGDSLWKISQEFYGAGHLFKRIIDANPGKLVDEKSVIKPGDTLAIPAA